MKTAAERKLTRWVHIIFSIPILGYIYGPVSEILPAALATRWFFLPIIILSGLWLWKGYWFKKHLKPRGSDQKET